MKKLLFLFVAALVLGGALGALLAQHSIHQRQQGLAVMWLLQRHTDALQAATQKQDCSAAQQAISRINMMADEVAQVFPLANAQDANFHQGIERLQQASAQRTEVNVCAAMNEALKRIRTACADCHRDYR